MRKWRDSLSTFPHFLFISSLSIHFLNKKIVTYEKIILGRIRCKEAPQVVPACQSDHIHVFFLLRGLLLECIFDIIQRSRSPEPSAALFELLRPAPDRLQNIFTYCLTCPFYEHFKFLCHLHEQAEESHSLLYWTRHWPRPPRSLHLQPRFYFPPHRQKGTTSNALLF